MGILSRALTNEEYQSLDWFPRLEGTDWTRHRWNAASRLLDRAKEIEGAQPVLSEAFHLLAWVVGFQCNEPLSPPYGPLVLGAQGRSGAMEDMEALDADLLAKVARDTADPWLRARFADVAVTLGPSTGPDWELGKIAVVAQLDYLRSVFLTDRAMDGVDECRRALRLLWVYAKKDGDLRDAYWNLIAQQVQYGLDHNDMGTVFALCEESMQRNREMCREFAPRLMAKGSATAQSDPMTAERYYELAGRMWHRLGDKEQARGAIRAHGEALVSIATKLGEQNMAAPHFLVQAISVLRRGRASAERVAELRQQLERMQLASLDAFKQHEFRIDVGDWIKFLDSEVVGPTFFEALLQVSWRTGKWLDFDDVRQEVIDRRKQGLASFFDIHHANDEGAVVSKTPALDPNNEDSVFQRMVSHARQTHLDLRGRVMVDHVTGILYSNFQPTFLHIKEIVHDSPMTPEGFSETLARGLYAGICDDWIAASAYLIPSVEPLVRSILRQRGVHTTAIRDDGTQQERGLSELLVMPEAGQVFGKGVLFELRVLLTETNGYNLRNEYCHGLVRDQGLRNAGTMCIWWTLLRLIMLPWREHPVVSEPPRDVPEGSGPEASREDEPAAELGEPPEA